MPQTAAHGLARETRQADAKSRRTPVATLIGLTHDPDWAVARIAWRNPKVHAARLREGITEGRFAYDIAANPALGADLVAALPIHLAAGHRLCSRDRMDAVVRNHGDPDRPAAVADHRPAVDSRIALARNKALPADLQAVLTGDPSARVRIALAGNRTITPATIDALIADASPKVLRCLLGNKNLTTGQRDGLVAALRADNRGAVTSRVLLSELPTGEDLLREIAAVSETAALEVVSRTDAPADVLADTCWADNVVLRTYAASHEATPEEAAVAAALLGTAGYITPTYT